MAFIGNAQNQQGYSPAIDVFSGNGSTTAFTLSRPVATTAQLIVSVANVVLNPYSGYSVIGNTITFTTAPASGTNNVWVQYTSPITQVIAPSQGTVGTTQLAPLTTLPVVGGYTATLPAATGQIMVSGNMPAFSVSRTGSDQTISAGTWSKVQFNTEVFDTNNNFDSTTNYRFLPTVAGYYQLNALILLGGSGINGYIQLYKNGSNYQYGNSTPTGSGAGGQILQVSTTAYANGTTDYFEVYGFSGGTVIQGGLNISAFTGCLVRAA